jgi:ribosomal protein L14E/L6E/L27E
VGLYGEDILLISDGKLRGMGKPKKKKMKHLIFTDAYLDGVGDALRAGGPVADREIRRALAEVKKADSEMRP